MFATRRWASVAELLLLVTLICEFVPFNPVMPGGSVDESWVLAINQAVSQGMIFGVDVIFTMGPFASIYTRAYHPATDPLMLYGSLYLAISCYLAGAYIARGRRANYRYLVGITILYAVFVFSRDSLLLSYPLLVGFCLVKLFDGAVTAQASDRQTVFWMALLFFPFGLLPLIKLSLLLPCALTAAIACMAFLLRRTWLPAVVVVACPALGAVIFWVSSGQPPSALFSYLHWGLVVISGYTEAMSEVGLKHEVIAYLLLSAFLLISIARMVTLITVPKMLLVVFAGSFLFVVFKAGFVMHDQHALVAANGLFICCFLVYLLRQGAGAIYGRGYLLIALTGIFLMSTVVTYAKSSPSVREMLVAKGVDITRYKTLTLEQRTAIIFKLIGVGRLVQARISTMSSPLPYFSAAEGIRKRVARGDVLLHEYLEAMGRLKASGAIPTLSGGFDIYPSGQSWLIASGNSWDPRPIFQSYCAYSPLLAEKNRDHLLGGKAPENIIFAVDPNFERFPALEDGPSWPVLLARYIPTRLTNGYLYLTRDAADRLPVNNVIIGSQNFSFGDKIPVPPGARAIFARMDIRHSTPGILMNILYKPSELAITVYLKSGKVRTFRLIAPMARAGFMISPLVEDTREFSLLYGAGSETMADGIVDSFVVAPVGGKWQWNDELDVTFEKMFIPGRPDLPMPN